MRIVINSPRLPSKPYGEHIYITNFVKALAELAPDDWEIDVQSNGLRGRSQHISCMHNHIGQGRVSPRWLPIPLTLLNPLVRYAGIPTSKCLFGPADLVHSLSNQWLPPSPRLVLTIQDISSLRFMSGKDSMSSYKELHAAYSSLSQQAQHLITISEFQRQEIVEVLGVNLDKITVIHNGVDTNLFHPPNPKEIEEGLQLLQSLGLKKPYFINLGGMPPRKNIPRLIEAFGRFRELYKIPAQLVITGNANLPTAVQESLNRILFKEDIHILGYLPQKTVVRLLQQAAALIFPSIYEGFGMPPLEAMACGVPVTMSDKASLPEIGQDAVIYFDPFDTEDIAAAMVKVLTDDCLRTACMTKGLKRSHSLTWKRHAQATLDIYKHLLGIAT